MLRETIGRLVSYGVRTGHRTTRDEQRTRDIVNEAVSLLLRTNGTEEVNDLVGYLQLTRDCIEPTKMTCKHVKGGGGGSVFFRRQAI